MKKAIFTVAVASAFALGLYSLFLASANAGKDQLTGVTGFTRTAAPADAGKITSAFGDSTEHDLAYVVLYTTETGLDPEVEIAARRAAQTLTNSGTAASVRLLGPRDPNFALVATQNEVGRFPAVLAVKKNGGIVLVTDEINEKILLRAYQEVWGKTSSCDDAKSAVY